MKRTRQRGRFRSIADRRRGLSLAETVVAVMLVGGAMVASLNLVGASRRSLAAVDRQGTGQRLAQDLMSEILLTDYADSYFGIDSFGITLYELAPGNRSRYDDVDDYHGWTASPPEHKDGTEMTDLPGWVRGVSVVWTAPGDLTQPVGNHQGVKRITVVVGHNNVQVAQLVALKTVGLPPLEACCLPDSTCADLSAAECAAQSGTSRGADTSCTTIECNEPLKVLFVVVNPGSLTSQEQARETQLESWGYAVTLIDEADSTADFFAAMADIDVVYISEEASSSAVGTKLTKSAVGVVNEEPELYDELGISSDKIWPFGTTLNIVDNAHYITEPFATGNLTILHSGQSNTAIAGTPAPGLRTLAQWGTDNTLSILNKGAAAYGGHNTSARHVQLPWGGNSLDFDELNDDGRTILRRSLEWAAETEAACSLARWTFDEGAGTTAADSSGNGYDLALTNMDPSTGWVAGRIGGALSFDGVDDFAITTQDFDPPVVGTVAFWMQVPGLPTEHGRILGISDKWEVRHVQPGTPDGIAHGLVFDLHVAGINTEFASDSTFGIPGQWYHIAAAFNASDDSFEIYVDGVLEKSGTRTQDPYPPDKLSIGTRTGSTDYWIGILDDLRLYSCMLSAADIAALAASGSNCGDTSCDTGEDPCNCADDCGAPAAFEQPGVDCDDGKDNDCDGQTDCDDNDCVGAAECAFCGDGNCDPDEDSCNCADDCGAAPGTEANCTDTVDNDCDGQTDCDDSDCSSDLACVGVCNCNGTYADNFQSDDFGGSTGSLDWLATPWIEVGESNGPDSGDIQVVSDDGSLRLRLRDNDNGGEGVERDVSLCANGTTTLEFIYRRSGLDSSSDYVAVEISPNGAAGPWTELVRFAGWGSDGSYQSYSRDISTWATPDTRILFKTSSSMGGSDIVYVDNVVITCSP